MYSQRKGFTLIELLVVIAIIGILSSIVLVNLNGSRQKARDVKRISDVKSIELALQLFLDANGGVYPAFLSTLAPSYLPNIPTPPGGVSGAPASYVYVPLKIGDGTCNYYHLGTVLEQANVNLTGDSDATTGSNGTQVATSGCSGLTQYSGSDFNGAGALCDGSAGTEKCFDITP
ncbi:MAG: type II secretion system GspH family protein [Candidatus Taylorbacteria bacterium]|nr:type II secretion system GspH family protein [Candidatus Taylorbacteria bacterium]